MKIVYVLLDMPLMKMAIVCHVPQNLGSLSTPKADACAIAHADSFLTQWLDGVFARQDRNSTIKEFVSIFLSVATFNFRLTAIPQSIVKPAT
jgi:hypothetical protein